MKTTVTLPARSPSPELNLLNALRAYVDARVTELMSGNTVQHTPSTLRTAQKFTQTDLARKSGVSVKVISRIERGETGRPHSSSLKRLAVALSVSVDEYEKAIMELKRLREIPTRGGSPRAE